MIDAHGLRFRHRSIPALHRRYGDAFTIRILPEDRRLVVFTGPSTLRVVFGVTDESRLAERPPLLNRSVRHSPAGVLGWGFPGCMVILLLAGHETTATALAWALREVGQDPHPEAKARDAASAPASP